LTSNAVEIVESSKTFISIKRKAIVLPAKRTKVEALPSVGTPDIEVIKKMELVMSASINSRNGHSDLIVTAHNGYDMAHTLLDYMRSVAGVKVEHFEVKEPTLDDVFLQLTGRRIED
jgi:ABC-type uncharacterized transport system ATPase subunit